MPKIGKVIVLRLSEKSHGNACGIGLADLTTREVYDKIDFESTYANSFACDGSFGYWTEYIPIVMSDEQEAIAGAVKMLRMTEPEACRIVKIKNTLNLREMEGFRNAEGVSEGRSRPVHGNRVRNKSFSRERPPSAGAFSFDRRFDRGPCPDQKYDLTFARKNNIIKCTTKYDNTIRSTVNWKNCPFIASPGMVWVLRNGMP